ncbi:unnamed protein product [Rotaria sp. Silwood2]|nr:unnamed protein product [Rotaria sp. Silwood2]CAF2820912.1 unnamed protein product [Rotaria sp. Silwood2]CAF3272428.1 unnamed protein product [Rotaria sp. Silwood2]CAF3995971.1 unnamed protein product [Rotaria sp. Silwood2]CAF4082792.1 unnamed protein product [Rotaria sp. Silwood2]
MSADSNDRIVTAARWLYRETYEFDDMVYKSGSNRDYMIALMEVAGADGILSEAERQWIVGFGAALDELQTYQPKGMDELLKVFHVESGHPFAKHSVLALIYDGFRGAGADQELHSKEVEAIYALGKTLGVTEEQIKQLHKVYMEEVQLRRKRLDIIFPRGTKNAPAEIDSVY